MKSLYTSILLLCAALPAFAQFTSPLATGVRLDPAGQSIDLGSMPLGMALAPGGGKAVVVLSGWREQGLQIVDLKSRAVTKTIKQEAAFYGVAFSPDGAHLYVSGGNDDSVFCYTWKDGVAALERKIVLGKQKEDKTGSRYPAGERRRCARRRRSGDIRHRTAPDGPLPVRGRSGRGRERLRFGLGRRHGLDLSSAPGWNAFSQDPSACGSSSVGSGDEQVRLAALRRAGGERSHRRHRHALPKNRADVERSRAGRAVRGEHAECAGAR